MNIQNRKGNWIVGTSRRITLRMCDRFYGHFIKELVTDDIMKYRVFYEDLFYFTYDNCNYDPEFVIFKSFPYYAFDENKLVLIKGVS